MVADSTLQVRFWGVRGSIPTPERGALLHGGNTSCVEIRLGSAPPLIIDAGSGIRRLGLMLREQFPQGAECEVLFSHFHWDHIQGLPFFAPLYLQGWRFKPLLQPHAPGVREPSHRADAASLLSRGDACHASRAGILAGAGTGHPHPGRPASNSLDPAPPWVAAPDTASKRAAIRSSTPPTTSTATPRRTRLCSNPAGARTC
jgi:glyoxylase-like metal-dependent hydrolase (beta-lactamase superfamily II)